MELIGQPTILVPQEPSLEDTLEAFRQRVNQPCHEIKDATMASQEVVRGQYMIDEDTSSNPYHEHVQTTTKLVREEIANEVVSEFS